MKLAILALASVLLVSGGSAFANFPKNDLYLMDGKIKPSDISETQFNQIIDAIITIWQPLAKLHGAELVVDKRWSDPTVNAYAQQSGNKWVVTMFGGLARRPEVTPDGFALVVCHELGHHFGGYYFYGNGEWASAEGQADYYATDVCAKKVFSTFFKNNIRHRLTVHPYVKEKCDAAWTTQPLRDLCYRSSEGGMSLATLLAALGRSAPPKYETPDQTRVGRSNASHPAAQCRLDTYIAGAFCNVPFDVRVIPGKGTPTGNNSKEAEAIASKVSCTQGVSARPGCWFKSQLVNYTGRI